MRASGIEVEVVMGLRGGVLEVEVICFSLMLIWRKIVGYHLCAGIVKGSYYARVCQ